MLTSSSRKGTNCCALQRDVTDEFVGELSPDQAARIRAVREKCSQRGALLTCIVLYCNALTKECSAVDVEMDELAAELQSRLTATAAENGTLTRELHISALAAEAHGQEVLRMEHELKVWRACEQGREKTEGFEGSLRPAMFELSFSRSEERMLEDDLKAAMELNHQLAGKLDAARRREGNEEHALATLMSKLRRDEADLDLAASGIVEMRRELEMLDNDIIEMEPEVNKRQSAIATLSKNVASSHNNPDFHSFKEVPLKWRARPPLKPVRSASARIITQQLQNTCDTRNRRNSVRSNA